MTKRSSKKIYHLMIDMSFIADGKLITWAGSATHLENEKHKRIVFPYNLPSTFNLLTHYLGKCIEGKNGENELAIVHDTREME